MSPGQDIPAGIKTLAVSAPKIERGSARRIGHQNNGYCPKHRFSFWALRYSAASTSFSNTFLKVLLSRMANVGCRHDQCLSAKLRYSNSREKAARRRSGRIENTALFSFFGGSVFSNHPTFNNDHNLAKSCRAVSDWITDAK